MTTRKELEEAKRANRAARRAAILATGKPAMPRDALPLSIAFRDWSLATRKRLGISRYALQDAGWIWNTTLRALENNASDPRLSTYVAICQGMGQDPGRLLNRLIATAGMTMPVIEANQ